MTLNIITVVGARPQFIKAAALSRHIVDARKGLVDEKIIHTGQHYDQNMSDIFFEKMHIPKPTFRFEVASCSHGAMTAKMINDIEAVLTIEKPDVLLVYGDTNSTLAGALAAVKLHIPVAHVEAGLRSFNMKMPEEVNRILTDRISTRLYCPTDTACLNLSNEGITEGVLNSGDIMLDVANYYGSIEPSKSNVMTDLKLNKGNFILSTIHRAENTDSRDRITKICQALNHISREVPVVLPIHPRTKKIITDMGLVKEIRNIHLIEPLPFLEMLLLVRNARLIVTDSGGLQKEAYFHSTPCITIRDQTEWLETLDGGWNRLVPAEVDVIVESVLSAVIPRVQQKNHYGNGQTSAFIIDDLLKSL